MLSADGEVSVLCESCEIELWELSGAVVLHFSLITNLATFYPLCGSKWLSRTQQSRRKAELRARPVSQDLRRQHARGVGAAGWRAPGAQWGAAG